MLNFIRKWWHERRRGIFKFWDGTALRRADPIVIWRGILADEEFEIERDTALIEANDAGAWGRCIACTRRIFNLPPVDAGGLPEQRVYEIFQAYCLYVAALKKNFNHWPTASSRSTGTAPQFGQIWPPPPNPGPDCSSTPAEPNSVPRELLPMG